MEDVRMVPVVTGSTAFEAKVLVARLGAEGILWQLRGAVDSIYPLGEGVDVLVAADDADRARELLLGDEVDAALDGDDEAPGSGGLWLVVVAMVALVAFAVARIATATT